MLEQAAYVVLMAQAAHAAFMVLDRNRPGFILPDIILPDIILIDAVMLGTSGLEACIRLKATAALAAIPVIFMTGLSQTEHVVRAFEAGATGYVTKPLQLDEVMARLNVHVLAARRAQAAHRALDGAGRFLFAVDLQGRLLWATPQAASLLGSQATPIPVNLAARLRNGGMAPGETLPPAADVQAGSGMRLSFMGVPAPDELPLRIAPHAPRRRRA